MKFAVYSLIAMVVAGIGAGVSLIEAPVESRSTPAAREHVAYVDLDSLLTLHPAWQVVEESGAAARQAGRIIESVGSLRADDVSSMLDVPRAVSASRDLAHREELESRAAETAESALGDLQSAQNEALAKRLSQTRENMTENARAEIGMQSEEIHAEAAREIGEIVRRDWSNRLNIKLKENALQIASGLPSVDSEKMGSRLSQVREERHGMDELCGSAVAGIESEARDCVDEIWARENDRIEAALSLYERGERRRIEGQVGDVRLGLMGELESYGTAPVRKIGGGPSSEVDDRMPCVSRAEPVDQPCDIAALKVRIKADVARVVRELAKERDMRVVFYRIGVMDDETELFAGIVRKRGQNMWRPVLCAMSG